MNYFAYGSNMNTNQMTDRCPKSVLKGKAKVSGYRFIINGRGVASIIPDSDGIVYGVLWEIDKLDEGALDEYEGIKWGTYKKVELNLDSNTSMVVKALIYIAEDNTPGIARDNYIEKIIDAAKQHGFPGLYIEELESWGVKRK